MARLFVEELTVIDCALLDVRRGLLGQSWLVDLELGGELDEQGMVFDFGDVKPVVKAVIDETVDHRLLVPLASAALRLEQDPSETRLWFRTAGGEVFHRSPADALCLLDAPSVEPDVVEARLVAAVLAMMPENVRDVRLTLREEAIGGAAYRYVHGLRQHLGNCQRIAHGHRSRIQVFRDGERSEPHERWIADRWRDVYLGCRADLQSEVERDGEPCYRFRYQAAQGEFELVIPKSRCDLLETESTVECIAAHLAGVLKGRDPSASYRVRAYEGVRKGAIAGA
jgi:6-pyruvoyl-tetrahydropterin synthase